MKKKLLSILLVLAIVISVGTVMSSAYDEELANSITSNYSTALSIAGSGSFHGYCNLATAYQLRALGIYSGSLDYSGSGDSWYSHFSGVSETSGGYQITTYGGADCLYNLVDDFGNDIRNVVVSFGTGGSSGSRHVMLISAIIDGYVYFADSFGCTYTVNNRAVYYPEGTCTVLSLGKFMSVYRDMNGYPYGCVYFTNGKAEPISKDDTTNEENTVTNFYNGDYKITADSGLRVRSNPDTESSVYGVLSNGDAVTVLDVKDGWGKILYNGNMGWIKLEFAEYTGEEPEEQSEERLFIDSITANNIYFRAGEAITWTASSSGTGTSLKYTFSVYYNDELIYTGDKTENESITYSTTDPGLYQVYAEVTDEKGSKATMFSDVVTVIEKNASIIKGDANRDGRVTSSDARVILRFSANLDELDTLSIICADIDGNGKVTSADARECLRISANIK